MEAACVVWVLAYLARRRWIRKDPFVAAPAAAVIVATGMLVAFGFAAIGRVMMEVELREFRADAKGIAEWRTRSADAATSGSAGPFGPLLRSHAGRFMSVWVGILATAEDSVIESPRTPITNIVASLKSAPLDATALHDEVAKRERALQIYRDAYARMDQYVTVCEQAPAWNGWPLAWTREFCDSIRQKWKTSPIALNLFESEIAILAHISRAPHYGGASRGGFDSEPWQLQFDKLLARYNAAVAEAEQAGKRASEVLAPSR